MRTLSIAFLITSIAAGSTAWAHTGDPSDFSVSAGSIGSCDGVSVTVETTPGGPVLSELASQVEKIIRPAVSVLKISGPVHCRAPVPDRQQMIEWLMKSAQSSPLITRTVNGVLLENQPTVLVELFEKMTTVRMPAFSAKQKMFRVPEGCREFVCATEVIFGGSRGVTHAYLAKRYGFYPAQFSGTGNPAPDPPSRFRHFSDAEMKDVLAAVAEIPEALEEVVTREFIARVDGVKPERPWNWGDNTIQLFNPWGAQSSSHREITIYHEWAHLVGHYLKLDTSAEWLALSRPGSGYVSGYAENDSGEDFAESVAAYRYNPRLLLKKDEKKYDFIKSRVFSGREFLSKECR